MQGTIDILRLISLGQIGLLIYFLGRRRESMPYIWPSIFFLICVAAYLLAYWQVIIDSPFFFYAFLPFSVALPLSFWLFSKSVFDDRFQWKNTYTVWVIVGILLHTAWFRFNDIFWPNPQADWQIIVRLPPYLISLVWWVLGLFEAVRTYKDDLVIPRLQARKPFVVGTNALIFITLISLIALQHDELPLGLELAQKSLIIVLNTGFLYLVLHPKYSFFLSPAPIPETLNPFSPEKTLIEALDKHMVQNKAYKQEGLTIPQLAELLGTKEYRLRRIINRNLGYANFNQFLNSYRITEACKLLSEEANHLLTVREIAYEVGYYSLSPFNMALRDHRDDPDSISKKSFIFSKGLKNHRECWNPSAFFRIH